MPTVGPESTPPPVRQPPAPEAAPPVPAAPDAEAPPAGLAPHDPGQHSADYPAPVEARAPAVTEPARESLPLSARGDTTLVRPGEPAGAVRIARLGDTPTAADGSDTAAAEQLPPNPWWPVPAGVLTVLLTAALYVQRPERKEAERAP